MSELNIIYEDKYLIGVEKPYGVMSQGNEKTKSLCDDIGEYLRKCGENNTVYVIHRLDKTTGGVIVFAKTKEAASKMSALVQNGGFHKIYYAVVEGKLEKETDVLSDLLYHDKVKNKTYVVKRERKGVKKAKLSYLSLREAVYNGVDVTKVEVKLYTGRTHQIRVQFASRKHPLVGDKKYGAKVSSDNIALWSKEISFVHPITKEFVKISAEPRNEVFKVCEH